MTLSSLHNLRVTGDSRGVVEVAFDLPDRSYNVINSVVLAELQMLLDDVAGDPAVRLLVFRSAKESGFLAGADLREIRAILTRQVAEEFSAGGQQIFRRIAEFAIPTAAVIHGPCLGGGLEFALACRYRMAWLDERTQFAAPEGALGLLPAWGGTQSLPEVVGLSNALWMILDGARLSAKLATKIGLVDAAWPPDRFPAAAERFLAKRLAGKNYHRRRSGILASLRDRTRIGQSILLQLARRRAASEKCDQARAEALEAIEHGLRHGREAGLAREREAFAHLLFTSECRQQMEGFFHRNRALKRPAAE